jgi:hypothetical protein
MQADLVENILQYLLTRRIKYDIFGRIGDGIMEAKLTLRLDDNIINSAKMYAQKKHKSLSKLVEDYFTNLSYEKETTKSYPPLIEHLSGVISAKDLTELARTDDRARYILRQEQ